MQYGHILRINCNVVVILSVFAKQARIHHWGWVGMHPPHQPYPKKNCSLAACLQVISSK